MNNTNYKVLAHKDTKVLLQVTLTSEELQKHPSYQNLSRTSKRSNKSNRILQDTKRQIINIQVQEAMNALGYKHFYAPNPEVYTTPETSLVSVQGFYSYKDIVKAWDLSLIECNVSDKDIDDYVFYMKHVYSSKTPFKTDIVQNLSLVSLGILSTNMITLNKNHYLRGIIGSYTSEIPPCLEDKLIGAKVGDVVEVDSPYGYVCCYVETVYRLDPITDEELENIYKSKDINLCAKQDLQILVNRLKHSYMCNEIIFNCSDISTSLLPLKMQNVDRTLTQNIFFDLLVNHFIPAENKDFNEKANSISLEDLALDNKTNKAKTSLKRKIHQSLAYIYESSRKKKQCTIRELKDLVLTICAKNSRL